MTDKIHDLAAVTVASIATKTTNVGAAAAVAGGFMADNWASIGGLLIAVAGFAVNWWFRYQTYKLEREARDQAPLDARTTPRHPRHRLSRKAPHAQ